MYALPPGVTTLRLLIMQSLNKLRLSTLELDFSRAALERHHHLLHQQHYSAIITLASEVARCV